MRLVFILILILGVGLAGLAVYMARGFVGDYQSQLDAERAARAQVVPTVKIFAVKEPLRYGDQVTEQNIRQIIWQEDAVPEGAYLTIDELFPEGEKRFRTVLRTMETFEPILAVKVTNPGEDAGVSSRLSQGMRAFAIRVDVSSGVSGFLRPGDRVDVYWSGGVASVERGSQEVTKLIQTGVRLIAVDQTADSERSSPTIARTVTVEVSPRQVAALALAQSTGRLLLSLVGNNEEGVAEAVEINQNELLGIVHQEIAPVITRKVCTVKTRRGAEIIETEIACPEN